ncbi:unnamed protein product [Mycena citricolor]|uniref:Uncharacterized protein n=1 Tax=Mycena citricolor TaxID=2018698 RepID=A0AAD2GR69_9AGAR|nr:unnamed protein product [Mycena citricolor]
MSQLRADLPSELWLYIQRLATAYYSPLNIAYDSDFVYRYDRAVNPFDLIRPFHKDARSFSLVSSSWNLLAAELLYESICVNRSTQSSLFAALRRAGVSNLVRAVSISEPADLDFYCALFTLCPRLEVLVLQHSNDHSTTLDIDLMTMTLGRSFILPQLRFVFWNRFVAPDGLLDLVLQVSPNVQSFFSDGSRENTNGLMFNTSRGHAPGPLSLSSLRRLEIRSSRDDVTLPLLLSLGCEHTLTRLGIPVQLLREANFPILPRTTVLELFGSRTAMDYPRVSRLFPNLQELCFDLWNAFEGPMALPHVAVIRLHSVVAIVWDWTAVERTFALFCDTGELPCMRRIVLYNMWHRIVGSSQLAPLLQALRKRGCDVEFPQYCICN